MANFFGFSLSAVDVLIISVSGTKDPLSPCSLWCVFALAGASPSLQAFPAAILVVNLYSSAPVSLCNFHLFPPDLQALERLTVSIFCCGRSKQSKIIIIAGAGSKKWMANGRISAAQFWSVGAWSRHSQPGLVVRKQSLVRRWDHGVWKSWGAGCCWCCRAASGGLRGQDWLWAREIDWGVWIALPAWRFYLDFCGAMNQEFLVHGIGSLCAWKSKCSLAPERAKVHLEEYSSVLQQAHDV